VTQSTSAFPDSPPLSPAARLLWLLLILSTFYLCYFHNLGAIGLVGPDEPRYAWIARDMQETGDWITPRLYGQPWFEKPPLYYWGAALSFKLFGVSETAARLPSAISALLATLALSWLALRLYGAETARWLLLLLPTTVGMIGFSHAAATDMPFAATLTIALVFAAHLLGIISKSSEVQPSSRSPLFSFTSLTSSTSFTSTLFGVFLGLATLAKGPAAIILSGGAVLLWAFFTKRWRDAFRCLHPIAIATFCLTALPWYILCARRNPDFFRVFIIEHNFKRFLTPEFQHLQPFWYYLPITLLAVSPWIFFLVLAKLQIITTWKQRIPIGFAEIFFLSWAGFTFLFFTISKSKLPGYIMPGIPPLVLLLANTVATHLKDTSRSSRWPLLATGLAFLALGVALQREAAKIPALLCVSPACGITRIWAVAACGGVITGLLAATRRLRISLFAAVITVLFLVVEIDRFLPNLDPEVSARDAIRTVTHVWPDFSARNAATWQLNRSFGYQLDYYTREEIRTWKAGDPRPTWVFVPKGKQQAVAGFGFRCVNFAVDPAIIPCRDDVLFRGLGGSNGNGSTNNLSNRQPR